MPQGGFRGQQEGATAVHEPVLGLWESRKSPQGQTVRFSVLGARRDPPQLPGRGFPLAPQDVGLVQLAGHALDGLGVPLEAQIGCAVPPPSCYRR